MNLGHLRNYNKGISLALGEYVWLINVDDYLRRRYVLERFVATLERHPAAAFVFCPAVQVHGRREGAAFGMHGPADVRVHRTRSSSSACWSATACATPAVMVRKASYDRMGMFPLDLPYAGDWYQWCRHAFYGSVAYLAEPMVCYRLHELNMTKDFLQRPAALISDELAVRWRVRRTAEELRLTGVAQAALDAIAHDYGVHVAARVAERSDGRAQLRRARRVGESVPRHPLLKRTGSTRRCSSSSATTTITRDEFATPGSTTGARCAQPRRSANLGQGRAGRRDDRARAAIGSRRSSLASSLRPMSLKRPT